MIYHQIILILEDIKLWNEKRDRTFLKQKQWLRNMCVPAFDNIPLRATRYRIVFVIMQRANYEYRQFWYFIDVNNQDSYLVKKLNLSHFCYVNITWPCPTFLFWSLFFLSFWDKLQYHYSSRMNDRPGPPSLPSLRPLVRSLYIDLTLSRSDSTDIHLSK